MTEYELMIEHLYINMAEHIEPTSRERPDGDTMKVRVDLGMQTSRVTRFRLARINAYELSEPGLKGFAARDYLRTLWPYGTKLVSKTWIDPKDKYDRWIAEVWLDDGRNLSDEMVRAGHAVYQNYSMTDR